MAENKYPEDTELEKIKNWKHEDGYLNLLLYVQSLWLFDKFKRIEVSDGFWFTFYTMGWSGNEEIIGALQSNAAFWLLCWQESRRGGRYQFLVNRNSLLPGETIKCP